jgi:hypothetical protein
MAVLTLGGGEVLLPGIKPVGFEAQFLRDHRGRLATAMPVLERFALEGFIEFTTDFNRCLVHGTSFHCSPNSPSVNSKQPQASVNCLTRFSNWYSSSAADESASL